MAKPAWALGEPVPDRRLGLVARCVVHDDMDVEIGRHVALHLVAEGANLTRPMPPLAVPYDRTRGPAEGGEQRGRAVALVVVAAPFRSARPHRRRRPGAVEHLDLVCMLSRNNGVRMLTLGDAKYQRAVPTVEIEAYGVAHLVDQQRDARQLEGLRAVRLQAEGAPDPVHRRRREAGCPGHRVAAPVGWIIGQRLQRPRHHLGDLVVADLARRTGPRLVVEPGEALGGETSPPRADGPPQDPQLLCDG